MAASARVICASEALVDGGAGVRFSIERDGRTLSAFAVRHNGAVRAYLNRCAHVGIELDWQPGQFFDPETGMLMCATHGALYDPATGVCRAGPCVGGRLIPVPVVERDGLVELQQDD
ncbi:MAG: Rieske 2Fe-2S domain-containing protein [Burkholderiales bacterium]|nr:Rieske 2Fe-2S domain-containing protein [Burkholderiales bacterium]PZN03410.1 MAG: (2Fe-2S)-binding protein [Pseudomonadota bacterium]